VAANEENGSGRNESHNNMKKLKMHTLLSIITFVLGVLLVIIVGYVEDDPSIPPVLMILCGIGWFIITRIKIRSLHKKLH
jgi:uncharacterized membrane protein